MNKHAPWMNKVAVQVTAKKALTRNSRTLYQLRVLASDQEITFITIDGEIPTGCLGDFLFPKDQEGKDVFTYKVAHLWYWPIKFPPKPPTIMPRRK